MSVILTLVGTKQAKAGLTFLHCGAVESCNDCKLTKVCQKLEPGRVYEVIKSRGIVHDCLIHEGGVTLVEVKEASVLAMLDSRSSIPGASMVYSAKKCSEVDCERAKYCSPLGLHEGDRFRVEEVLEKATSKCQNSELLALCRLRRIPAT
jgi:uncharacterized protein (UPF0179 family)